MASKSVEMIEQALIETGLPYEYKSTKGHFKIVLAGKMVGVTRLHGNNDSHLRAAKNVVSQIKRAAAQLATT